MTQFDFFILAMIGLSVLFAWIRGLSREVVTLLAIGAGFLTYHLFGQPVGAIFGDDFPGVLIGPVLLFVVGFIVASVVFEILVSKFWGRSPHMYDKIAGGVFGIFRGWLLVGLAYLALTYYFDENDMPPAIENAALKGLLTSGANLLEQFGLEKETAELESADAPAVE